jgi:hypothetical protein
MQGPLHVKATLGITHVAIDMAHRQPLFGKGVPLLLVLLQGLGIVPMLLHHS